MKTLNLLSASLIVATLTNTVCSGQKTTNTTTEKDSVTGDWKGTSICQVKDSPCHDEIAMYHISKTEKQNVYRCVGNKIVNGQEVEIGTIDFVYDPADHSLTNAYQSSTWKFKVSGDSMHGTLTQKDVLYRIIELKKVTDNKK